MTQYEAVFKRKSCRKYDAAPLATAELDTVYAAVSAQPGLYEADLGYMLVTPDKVRGLFRVEAPYYLAAYGDSAKGEALAAGFQLQLWSLWMCAQGYGTVWLGGSKTAVPAGKKPLIIIAFGKPAESIERAAEEFNRKPLADISTGSDPRLAAARLAQSGTNAQPWYFIARPDGLYVYQKRNALSRLMYPFPELDVGIALANLSLASEHENMPFSFSTDAAQAPTPPKGYDYTGVVQ